MKIAEEKEAEARRIEKERIIKLKQERIEQKKKQKLAEQAARNEFIEKLSALKSSANAGNANAQFDLGQAYFAGKYITQDIEKAKYWLGKAKQQGDGRAQFTLESIERVKAENLRIKRAQAQQQKIDSEIKSQQSSISPQNSTNMVLCWSRYAPEMARSLAVHATEMAANDSYAFAALLNSSAYSGKCRAGIGRPTQEDINDSQKIVSDRSGNNYYCVSRRGVVGDGGSTSCFIAR